MIDYTTPIFFMMHRLNREQRWWEKENRVKMIFVRSYKQEK